jgi:hypothetical protein
MREVDNMVHTIEIIYNTGVEETIEGDYVIEGGTVQINTYGKYDVDTIIIPLHSVNHINVTNDKTINVIV